MLKNKKYLCIVDYNLTRVGDVQILREYARSQYNLDTILFRANPTDQDYNLADHVINVGPDSAEFMDQALSKLIPFTKGIVAVLPFSDDAVAVGARLAESLGLKADSSILAHRAFSKAVYRQAEAAIAPELEAQNIFVPRSKSINSPDDLVAALADYQNLVLKPSCEGNNRGVLRLQSKDCLIEAFKEVKTYLKDGIVVEEVIPFEDEFSVDGIGSLSFCTQKLGSMGRYPVESGQIVPAPINGESLSALRKTSGLVNFLVGQNHGPFHNEIKHNPQTLQCAVIEPNRRPAGMRIWHLAEKAFGINFFHLWIDQLVAGKIPEKLPEPQNRVGIKMLKSPASGVLRFNTLSSKETQDLIAEINNDLLQGARLDASTFDFQWNSQCDSRVTNEPRDNSQFVAQICFKVKDLNFNLEKLMNEWAQVWEYKLNPFIETVNTAPAKENNL